MIVTSRGEGEHPSAKREDTGASRLRLRTACTLLALAVAVGITANAAAQYGGGPGGGGGGGGRGGMGGMGGQRSGPPQDGMHRGANADAPLNAGAIVQLELDRFEDDLKLTPAQLDTWRLYADKVSKLASDVARSRADARSRSSASANAVQHLEEISSVSGIRATAVDDIVVAGRAFYGTLNEEQKAIADRRMWMPVSLLVTGVVPPGMSEAVAGSGRRPPM
jgi:hypothetical protein